MGLPTIPEGSLRPSIVLTWIDTNGNPVDLTGAVITAKIYNYADASTVTSSGTFNILIPASGIFEWQLHANDAIMGNYKVQFIATFSSGLSPLKSQLQEWVVSSSL